MSVSDRVRDLVAPICTDLGLEIYDVEHVSGKVRVTVDRSGGVDLQALAVATRLIVRELDERNSIPSGYQLEVSSPGLERPLRTPDHFQRAVGRTVSIRLHPSAGDLRRISGVLTEADDDHVTVLVDTDTSAAADSTGPTTVRIRLADIERARTTFAWGGQPKPGKGPRAVRTPAAPEAEETA